MSSSDYRFFYREQKPDKNIAHLVRAFFEFSIKAEQESPLPHEVFPDGCVSILYRRNKRLGIELLLLKGLSLKTYHTEVFSGDIHWGIQFSPAACDKILRCDPNSVPTQPVFDEVLLPHLLSGMVESFSACDNFADAVKIYESHLKKLEILSSSVDDKVAKAIKLIVTYRGEIKISELADSLGISRRQLERRFRKSAGLTPKQWARTYRLRATAIDLIERDMNWAARAAEMGFADQSHLSHELENLTGRKPKAFKRKIDHIDHKDLIK